MSLMHLETYDALRAANVPDAEARMAARVTADVETRMVTLAERLNGLDSKLNWIGATTITLNVLTLSAILALAWQVLQRLPVR